MSNLENVDLRLGRFDAHGTTRALYHGRLIEIEHGIPGELVRAEIVGQRRRRGRITEVLEAAPDRVEAPCDYFRDWHCGGCQWQHMTYEGQLARKRHEVEAAMRAAGLDVTVETIHTPSEPWRYRSTASISLGKSAGFRRQASLAIVPMRDCPISHPVIGRVMASLNDALKAGALPDFRGRVRVDVRLTDRERLLACVRPSPEERPPSDTDLITLADVLSSLDEMIGVSVLHTDGSIKLLSGGDIFGTTSVDGRAVSLAAASFFQTNLDLLPVLIRRIREEAAPLHRKRVADVYGGVGIFGLFLASEADEVVIIESDGLAVQAGERTCTNWGLSNVRFVTARAEDALADESFHVVIVDPPRSGLMSPVLEELLSQRPERILYVSCLAQSLARDASVLAVGGYSVEHLELFDFYPQTYHVEMLAVLRPAVG